jgi:hypothetical protein
MRVEGAATSAHAFNKLRDITLIAGKLDFHAVNPHAR